MDTTLTAYINGELAYQQTADITDVEFKAIVEAKLEDGQVVEYKVETPEEVNNKLKDKAIAELGLLQNKGFMRKEALLEVTNENGLAEGLSTILMEFLIHNIQIGKLEPTPKVVELLGKLQEIDSKELPT